MKKFKRNERIAAIMKILGDNPNRIFPLGYFSEKFTSAKSTISEDLLIIKESMEKAGLGKIETISGAAGGVKLIPFSTKEEGKLLLQEICEELKDKDRILPGGFLYVSDIIFKPDIMRRVGEIFATNLSHKNADYIITVETKGVPLALMVAKAMNLPLVILRNENKVTEGTTVSINYLSGSSKKIQRMSLSKRAIKPGSKVIIIDDFMKAGGTARGMVDMMKEFNVTIEGIGVLISTVNPHNKLVKEYISLLILNEIDEMNGIIDIYPNNQLFV